MPMQGLFILPFYLSVLILLFIFFDMKIFVNSQEYELACPVPVSELASMLELPEGGVAVAVNNKIVRRDEWNTFLLKENDKVIVIKAACGG